MAVQTMSPYSLERDVDFMPGESTDVYAQMWWRSLASPPSEAPYDTNDRRPSVGESPPTGIRKGSLISELLEEAASLGDIDTFKELVQVISRAAYPAKKLLRAADLALSLNLISIAVEIVSVGKRHFPDNVPIQKLGRALSPPRIHKTPAIPRPGLALSQAWVHENASRYRGQWIAVRAGELVGSATRLKDLVEIVNQDRSNTLVTKVV